MNILKFSGIFGLAVAALSLGASVGRTDPADVNWSSNFGSPGLEGSVRVAVNWSGTLVVGGDIQYASGAPALNVAAWNGTRFNQLGAGLNGVVTSLAVVGSTLYAAGDFDQSGATPLPHIARWTGSAWVAVGTGAPDNAQELTLAADGSSLLLLGSFSTVGSPPVTAAGLASWNGTTWSAVGGYNGGGQPTAAARVGSILYVGGYGGIYSPLSSWDGSSWTYGYPVDGDINSLAAVDGILYIHGDFSSVDGGNVAADQIASWDGANFASLGGIAVDGSIEKIGADQGQLFAVGNFTSSPGPACAFWDGLSWTPGPYGILGSPVTFARVGADLFIGGNFTTFLDADAGAYKGAAGIVALNGVTFRQVGPGAGIGGFFGGYIQALGTFNNSLIATGSFYAIGNIGAAFGIAAWDGLRWSKLGSGLAEPSNNPSGSRMTTWNSKLVVTGYFTGAGAVNSTNIIAWDGVNWQSLDGGFSGQNAAVASYNGMLIAGSPLTSLGTAVGTGTMLGALARWTGTQWQTIGTLGSPTPLSDCGMTVWNGKLIFAAAFSSVNGVPAANIAQWDGTTWSPLGSGLNGAVFSVGVFNNQLYASGIFTQSGATPLPGFMARWTGSAWAPVGAGLNSVATGLESAGTRLYATGGFSAAGNNPAQYIASWDGTTWSALGTGLGQGVNGNDQRGLCLAPFNDGLFVGGYFNTAGVNLSLAIARWQLPNVSAAEIPTPTPGFVLRPPAPNPAIGRVGLSFNLPIESDVEATVFDAGGRLVKTLLAAHLAAGDHQLNWDGRDEASRSVGAGVYWVRVTTPVGQSSAKVVWLR